MNIEEIKKKLGEIERKEKEREISFSKDKT